MNYLNLLEEIKDGGIDKSNRTGIDTRFLPGEALRFWLPSGFPLLTTKKIPFYSVVAELFWFWTAIRDEKYLRNELGTSIWKGDAYSKRWLLKAEFPGDVGEHYGRLWRYWGNKEGKHIDQVKKTLNGLENKPLSRRHQIENWDPSKLSETALPPCHNTYHFIRDGQKGIHLVMDQRSADMFLGVPFNIASAALQLKIFAHILNLKAKSLTINLHDAHIYHNHFSQVEKQLSRAPRERPKLKLSPEITKEFIIDLKDNRSLTKAKLKDLIQIKDYNPHSYIKAPLNTGEDPIIEMIVARGEQSRVIGKNGQRPWSFIEKDMRRFVEITTDKPQKPIIVGRKTFEHDIPKPLKNRKNIILTRQKDYEPTNPNGEQVRVANSAVEAFDIATENHDRMTVIGGEQIYSKFLRITDIIYETLISEKNEKIKGDAHFPKINEGKWMKNLNWTIKNQESHQTKEGYDITFRTLKSEKAF